MKKELFDRANPKTDWLAAQKEKGLGVFSKKLERSKPAAVNEHL